MRGFGFGEFGENANGIYMILSGGSVIQFGKAYNDAFPDTHTYPSGDSVIEGTYVVGCPLAYYFAGYHSTAGGIGGTTYKTAVEKHDGTSYTGGTTMSVIAWSKI